MENSLRVNFTMHLLYQLFTPDEAFARLGQTRQTGCLVIVSPEQSYHLFVEEGSVVDAYAGSIHGERALELSLKHPNAFYTWLLDGVPLQKTMNISIAGFALKNAIAKDVHIAATSNVVLTSADKIVMPSAQEHLPNTYLVSKLNPDQKLFIRKTITILGREPSCDIVVPDTQVSRRHCLFQRSANGLSFRDLESTNGIRVNGISVTEGTLGDKDKIELGNHALEVLMER